MKPYLKIGLTAVLLVVWLLLSGFRAQTIIHDDGSETQDVLKVSETASGQRELRADANEFQKRNYTIMDYSNSNGEGFRAMKTITKEGANKSSVDRIVRKTHDGLICSTYYIDFTYDADSLEKLRLGMAMPENDADLEYIVSFPSGTKVVSNSSHADTQGNTYMWSLRGETPSVITLQATVWHKLFIYMALCIILCILLIVVIMEKRRRNVISWKRAAHIRKLEMLLLCIPVAMLGYMGYEYYTGTHVTAASLERIEEQQQEELLESREEDKRIHDASMQKERLGGKAVSRIRSETNRISSELRTLNRQYASGEINRKEARSAAAGLAEQARSLMKENADLSQADSEVLQQLVDTLVSEAGAIGDAPSERETAPSAREREQQEKNETNKRDEESADAASSEEGRSDTSEKTDEDKAESPRHMSVDTGKDAKKASK